MSDSVAQQKDSAELSSDFSVNGVSESCMDDKINKIVKILSGASVSETQIILKKVEDYVMLLPLQTNY